MVLSSGSNKKSLVFIFNIPTGNPTSKRNVAAHAVGVSSIKTAIAPVCAHRRGSRDCAPTEARVTAPRQNSDIPVTVRLALEARITGRTCARSL
jgi:hypothetical protein